MQWEGFSMYDIESVKRRFVGVKMIIRESESGLCPTNQTVGSRDDWDYEHD
jgi:hypothetical protein